MLAQRFPKADVPSVIRKLPRPPTATAQSGTSVPRAPVEELLLAALAPSCQPAPARESEPTNTQEHTPSFQVAAPPVPAIAPLRAQRYKVQFTADQRLHDKLRQAQDLMRHQVPDGDLAAVLERALDLLIAERMKQRFALGRKPRSRREAEPSKPESRHIPLEVRRAVIARDGQQCSYVSGAGQRCEQRGFLEFHHEEPYARGGAATATNIRVLCRAHNQLFAERDYGRAFMQARSGASHRS